MKKYLTPSIEINKFDVEDIITASSDVDKTAATLSDGGKALYQEYIAAGNTGAGDIAEFQW